MCIEIINLFFFVFSLEKSGLRKKANKLTDLPSFLDNRLLKVLYYIRFKILFHQPH